jgi:hypothetical protein
MALEVYVLPSLQEGQSDDYVQIKLTKDGSVLLKEMVCTFRTLCHV